MSKLRKNNNHLPVMLGYNGQIDKIVIRKVLHIVGMALGTIMCLPHTTRLHYAVVVEGSNPTHHKDNLAIAFVGVKTSGSSWAKSGIHYFNFSVSEITRIKFAFSTFKPIKMNLWNIIKIYNHLFTRLSKCYSQS